KLFCADGSWGLPPARVGRCQADKRQSIWIVFFLPIISISAQLIVGMLVVLLQELSLFFFIQFVVLYTP
ncbi:hypothetical protein, partial [Halalkalibacter lacteus]|uniref:hypothetical protein n=1 Tax=Halalkalibacter lacteus TaxID=3090663 RepID=UPI002FC623C4